MFPSISSLQRYLVMRYLSNISVIYQRLSA